MLFQVLGNKPTMALMRLMLTAEQAATFHEIPAHMLLDVALHPLATERDEAQHPKEMYDLNKIPECVKTKSPSATKAYIQLQLKALCHHSHQATLARPDKNSAQHQT